MENNNNLELEDFFLKAKVVVDSNCIKYSKWELVWRIGITAAVVASIVIQVL